jgi:hypothetical protein
VRAPRRRAFRLIALAVVEATDLNDGMLVKSQAIRSLGGALLAVAALASSCEHDAPPPPPPPQAAPNPKPKPKPVADVPAPVASPGESDVAARWIADLRARRVPKLARAARTPFDFRDSRAKPQKGCPSGVAATAKAVTAIATCLANDKLLHAALLANPSPRVIAVARETLPDWTRAWSSGLRPELRPLSVFVHDDTSTFEILLLVTDEGVSGVWQRVTLAPK